MLSWLNLNSWILGYMFGIIPSGHLISRAKGIDISNHGSGNVGATNVALVVGKMAGILTLLADVSKGVIAIATVVALTESHYSNGVALSTALGVVCGHCFSIPPFLKGGKGVATSLGVVLVITPTVGILALVVFLVVLIFSRIVSLASITSTASAPLISWIAGNSSELTQCLAILAIIVIVRHRTNLVRMWQGTEAPLTRRS